jgi:hypothetical protein
MTLTLGNRLNVWHPARDAPLPTVYMKRQSKHHDLSAEYRGLPKLGSLIQCCSRSHPRNVRYPALALPTCRIKH